MLYLPLNKREQRLLYSPSISLGWLASLQRNLLPTAHKAEKYERRNKKLLGAKGIATRSKNTTTRSFFALSTNEVHPVTGQRTPFTLVG